MIAAFLHSFQHLFIVPTLLNNEASITENLNRLEVHFLANPDDMLRFGLLVDFVDAPTKDLSPMAHS